MHKQEIEHDISQLIKLMSYLKSIEQLEVDFKFLDPEPFDKLSRQAILTKLQALYVELGKQEYLKSVSNGRQGQEGTSEENHKESQVQDDVQQ